MAFFRKKGGHLGLDIGSHLVKLVELQKMEEQYELSNLGVAHLFQATEERDKIPHSELIVETIRSLLYTSGIEAREVTIAMSSREVIVKRIEMDRMTEEEVGQIIKWEAEQHIPFNIDDVYLDFHILNSGHEGDQMEVLLVAGKKINVDSRVELAVASGLQPTVVDVDAFAIQNAFEVNYPEAYDEVVCLLNIGRDVTVISLARRGAPLFIRDIPFGNSILVEKLRKGLGVSIEDAESYILGIFPEGVQEEEARTLISAGSEDLVVGMTRTFNYLKTLGGEEKPSKVYLSGGGAKIPGLTGVLEDQLDVPLEIINPLRNLKIREGLFMGEMVEEVSPLLVQAVGLGLR
jgi:type IV pilus assembly protein PilM